MARQLIAYVHAVELLEDGSYGRSQTFAPGQDVPDWARAVITNPDVWDGEDDPAQDPLPEPERPRGNASRDKWADYATGRGIDVEDDMTRDDIIAAVDLADEE